MSFGYYLFAAIIVCGIFKLPAILRFYKKRKEDAFLSNVDRGTRIPAMRSKPIKGSRRSKEQIKIDNDTYQKALGNKFRRIAKADRIKAERVGSTGYIWRGDDCCERCERNNGKKFKWNNPPTTGHPGEGLQCENGYCRCWAETIVPKN